MKARIKALGMCATLIPLATFGGENDGLLSQPDLGFAKGGGLVGNPPPSRGWRIGLGPAPMIGVDAEFSGLGVFRNPRRPLPLGGGQDYEFDNGFVRVDSTGNARDNTWNWGYDEAGQYDPAGGGSMAFSIASGLGDGKTTGEDDLAHGVEAFAYYGLGELPALNLGAGPARWGLKATFHYANISIDEADSLAGGVSRVTDSFGLNGVVPPLAPYAGSFNGPGALLSDNPTRTTAVSPRGSVISGEHELEVNLFGLTVGPYLEMPIRPGFTVSLEGGFSLAVADGDYDFSTTTRITGAGTQTNSGGGNETSLLPGVSVGLTAFYDLGDGWAIYGGARYQYYSPLEIDAGTAEAEVDFGGAFVLSAGAAFSF